MDKLRALVTFARVVETGSLSGAARALDTSLASVSRQLAALEANLGIALLNRTTRRLSLTAAGRTYYERVKRILGDLEEADLHALSERAVPSGRLHVSAPILFGRIHLARAIAAFVQRYPQVNVALSLNDGYVNLVDEAIDVAVRMGELEESNFVARPLGTFRRVICGSPAYFKRRGYPSHPTELADHDCLLFTSLPDPGVWHLQNAGSSVAVQVNGPLRTNNQEAAITAAEQGLGLVLVAPWAIRNQLSSGLLQHTLPGWHQSATPVSALFARSRLLSAKTRAFVDFLADYWKSAAISAPP